MCMLITARYAKGGKPSGHYQEMTSCQAAMTRRGSTAGRMCTLAICLMQKLLDVML